MPSCFQLIPKGEKEPKILQQVDEELCKHFNVPVDPKLWYRDWYNFIGFKLATGKTFEQIREDLRKFEEEDLKKGDQGMLEADRALIEVANYLEEHYEVNSFYSPFK